VEIVIRLQLELPPGMSLMAAPVPDEPLGYRIPAAAAMLGVGKTKVAELVARGDLPSIKVDDARVIPADGLRAYMARRAGDGDAKAG
jgi:excisionase family DNA binding protein